MGARDHFQPSERYRSWVSTIGRPPRKIYEIGSGRGEMVSYMAGLGFKCRATEITRERGEEHAADHPKLSWGISDGVHLQRFEVANFYDVVISDQLIEHLHPDDLYEHLKGVFSILSSEGRYIFCTPNRLIGPGDISRVFKCDRAIGMHLKEYTNRELKRALLQVGFRWVSAVLTIPLTSIDAILLRLVPDRINDFVTKRRAVRGLLGFKIGPMPSSLYLEYLCVLERLISVLPRQAFRRRLATLSILIMFSPRIFMVAQKG